MSDEKPVFEELSETSEIKAKEARKRGLQVEYDRIAKAAIEPDSQNSQDSTASDYSISYAPTKVRKMYTHQQERSDKDIDLISGLRRRYVEADAELRSNLEKLAELASEDETLSSKVEINTDKNREYPDVESPPAIDMRISVAANDKLSAQQVVDLVASSLVQLLDNVSPDQIPEKMDRILASPSNVNYGRKRAPTNITDKNINTLYRFDLFDTAITKALNELDKRYNSTTRRFQRTFISYFKFIKDKIYTWLGLPLVMGGYAKGKTRRHKRNKQNKSKKGKQRSKRSKRRRRTNKIRTHKK